MVSRPHGLHPHRPCFNVSEGRKTRRSFIANGFGDFAVSADAVLTEGGCKLKGLTALSVGLQPCIDHFPQSRIPSADGKIMLITANK